MANEFTPMTAVGAVAVAAIYITAFSLVKEPYRKTINALIIAGAGGVYWSGGLGTLEFAFAPLMFFLAYKGLTDYKYIAIGWLCHTAWDIVHHFYANPIVPFVSSSSAGCAICDPLLAVWFFFGAPSVFMFFQKQTAV